MTKQGNYESIKSRILKLQELVQRGEEHEAQAAKRLLDQSLEKYGLTLEEILAGDSRKEWYRFSYPRGSWVKALFCQCAVKIVGTKEIQNRKGGNKSDWMELKLTPYQYAELTQYWAWNKKQFAKELKKLEEDFLGAYIHTHDMYASESEDDSQVDEVMTDKEREQGRRIFQLMSRVEDVSYHKMLE